MENEVILVIEGDIANIMELLSPSTYREYLSIGKSLRKILYVRLQKVIYGCICSALLFYLKLKGKLEPFGFLLNPYDACVANKWVNVSQMAVTWHANDLKISNKDAGEVTKIIAYLESIYDPMVLKLGNKHTYMGMETDFTENGTVKVSMSV